MKAPKVRMRRILNTSTSMKTHRKGKGPNMIRRLIATHAVIATRFCNLMVKPLMSAVTIFLPGGLELMKLVMIQVRTTLRRTLMGTARSSRSVDHIMRRRTLLSDVEWNVVKWSLEAGAREKKGKILFFSTTKVVLFL